MDRVAIIGLGRPGSGKGTQFMMLEPTLRHLGKKPALIATGNFFRRMKNEGSWDSFTDEILADIDFYRMERGYLLPDDLTMRIVNYQLEKAALDEVKVLLLDGIPRTVDQDRHLIDMLKSFGFNRFGSFELCISCEEATRRLLSRNEGRSDDGNKEVIERRQRLYEDSAHYIEQTNRQVGSYLRVGNDTMKREHVFALTLLHLDHLLSGEPNAIVEALSLPYSEPVPVVHDQASKLRALAGTVT